MPNLGISDSPTSNVFSCTGNEAQIKATSSAYRQLSQKISTVRNSSTEIKEASQLSSESLQSPSCKELNGLQELQQAITDFVNSNNKHQRIIFSAVEASSSSLFDVKKINDKLSVIQVELKNLSVEENKGVRDANLAACYMAMALKKHENTSLLVLGTQHPPQNAPTTKQLNKTLDRDNPQLLLRHTLNSRGEYEKSRIANLPFLESTLTPEEIAIFSRVVD